MGKLAVNGHLLAPAEGSWRRREDSEASPWCASLRSAVLFNLGNINMTGQYRQKPLEGLAYGARGNCATL